MPDDERTTSRRNLAGAAAAGLAAVVASPAMAQISNNAKPLLAPAKLTDPFNQQSGPPFLPQSQPWPGLQKNMSPVPDSGENSYVGTGWLAGRKALITGGDSGIGRAAAIAFAREGADVAISYLPAEEPDAQDVVRLVEQAGRKAIALPGDIRDENFCQKLIANAASELGGLDILVSNAARQHTTPSILDISSDYFDWTIKTNIYAMFWIVKAAIPHMPPGSSIICTTSVNAYNPEPDLLDYSMTKGAIMIFVKALAKQMISKGIRVNGVAPGPFWTPLQVPATIPKPSLWLLAAKRPSVVPASRLNSRRFTYSSPRPTRATSPAKFMAPRAVLEIPRMAGAILFNALEKSQAPKPADQAST